MSFAPLLPDCAVGWTERRANVSRLYVPSGLSGVAGRMPELVVP
jgi:hypothetical protein